MKWMNCSCTFADLIIIQCYVLIYKNLTSFYCLKLHIIKIYFLKDLLNKIIHFIKFISKSEVFKSFNVLLEEFVLWLFESDSWDFQNLFFTQTQNGVPVWSGIKTNLVEFSSFPVVVEGTEPFVNSQVMKSDVSNDFLFKSWSIGGVWNSILKTKGGEFGISAQTGFNWFWDWVSELFNEVFQRE